MSNIFFIADLHFGHKKVIEFEKDHRPFATIEEHDEELVRRWNGRVSKKDSIWVLGDFCFGKQSLEIAGRLNGTKRLVMGNHDLYPAADYLKYFTRVCGVVEFKGMILSHIPVHDSQFPRYSHNIHGHLHSKKVMKNDTVIFQTTFIEGVRGSAKETSDIPQIIDSRYINVSAEQIDLTPIALEELAILSNKIN